MREVKGYKKFEEASVALRNLPNNDRYKNLRKATPQQNDNIIVTKFCEPKNWLRFMLRNVLWIKI
ncbi:CLUMA_CG007763, isoform A [Clunio marinus]|uniref:CLUMA_CG007763, isoform A n=1 Tax=Clunio marinus TaxID=568069 RepID=A0A1J1I1P5_9DIPT|nr:CLUMA_CG007763, isoform A [Clunio marinus]